MEDEITDLDNVDLDAAEISRIFADDDSEEETRRKRKGRKKRNCTKTKVKTSKTRVKKTAEKKDSDESGNSGKNGKVKSSEVHDAENGSHTSDVENSEDVRGDFEDDDDDEDDSATEKPKSRGKLKERKKPMEIDLADYTWMCCDCPEASSNIFIMQIALQ